MKSELPSNIQEEFKGELPNPCTTLQFITFQKNQKEINQYTKKIEQKIESIPSGVAMQEAKGSNDQNVKKFKIYYIVQSSRAILKRFGTTQQ